MADITMCKDKECPHKDLCYRFTAPVNPYRQAYFSESPLQQDGTCQYFWERD